MRFCCNQQQGKEGSWSPDFCCVRPLQDWSEPIVRRGSVPGRRPQLWRSRRLSPNPTTTGVWRKYSLTIWWRIRFTSIVSDLLAIFPCIRVCRYFWRAVSGWPKLSGTRLQNMKEGQVGGKDCRYYALGKDGCLKVTCCNLDVGASVQEASLISKLVAAKIRLGGHSPDPPKRNV